MEVSGKLKAPVALTLGKEPLAGGRGGGQNQSGLYGEEKHHALSGIEFGSSGP
jgi:hypothetical protein